MTEEDVAEKEEAASAFEKLLQIQSKLHAPKSQRNDFGKYNYRSCEDILEAAKPICLEHRAVILLKDELKVPDGCSDVYIRATATMIDLDTSHGIHSTAYAREPKEQKGMTASQISGSASSYARKYALGGLLGIDDSKVEPSPDPDSLEPPPVKPKATVPNPKPKPSGADIKFFQKMDDAKRLLSKLTGDDAYYDRVMTNLKYQSRKDIPANKREEVIDKFRIEMESIKEAQNGVNTTNIT